MNKKEITVSLLKELIKEVSKPLIKNQIQSYYTAYLRKILLDGIKHYVFSKEFIEELKKCILKKSD